MAKFEVPDVDVGLIICGSHMISHLTLPVDKQFCAPHIERSWMAPLEKLAKEGFKVIVPEGAAYESGNMLASRHRVDDCFDNSLHMHPERDTMREAQATSTAFLQRVVNGEVDGFSISPAEACKAQSAFTRPLTQLRKSVEGFLACPDIHTHSALAHKQDIIAATKALSGQDVGPMSTLDYVKSLPLNWKKPIFYLNDDPRQIQALHKARPDLKICYVNLKGYLRATHETGLLKESGIYVPKSDLASLGTRLAEQELERWKEYSRLKGIPQASAAYILRQAADCSFPYEQIKENGGLQDHLFQQTVNERHTLQAQARSQSRASSRDEVTPEQEARLCELEAARKEALYKKFARHAVRSNADTRRG